MSFFKRKKPSADLYNQIIDIMQKHIKPACYRATDDPAHYPAIPLVQFCAAAGEIQALLKTTEIEVEE